jgi:hypothetical protein
MPISFKELMETYELASMGSSEYGEHHAYLCRESGKIYWYFRVLRPRRARR